MSELKSISSEGIRAIAFNKQQLGDQVKIYLVQPTNAVIDAVARSSFCEDVQIIEHTYSPEMVSV
jgi:hypothetical protein